jgi:hypothetical protein
MSKLFSLSHSTQQYENNHSGIKEEILSLTKKGEISYNTRDTKFIKHFPQRSKRRGKF